MFDILKPLNLGVSIAVLTISFLNYSFVKNIKNLQVHKSVVFVHAIYPLLGVVLLIKLTASHYMGVCIRPLVDLAILIILFIFNYKLFKELEVKSFDEDSVVILTSSAVLWLIFERIDVIPCPYITLVVSILLIISSIFIFRYLKLVDLLVVPPDLKTPIKLLLVFAILFSISDFAHSIGCKQVMRGMTIASDFFALASAVCYIKRLNELVKI